MRFRWLRRRSACRPPVPTSLSFSPSPRPVRHRPCMHRDHQQATGSGGRPAGVHPVMLDDMPYAEMLGEQSRHRRR